MTNEPSPRPWRVADPFDDGFPVVRDANERQVATLDGETPDTNEANAALIVAAVNERDRLRDIVRRLSRRLANYITSESENDLLREARAAIGDSAP